MRATIASILFLLFLSAGGQTLIDSYPESNYDANTTGYAATRQCVGQSFTVTTACALESIAVYIGRTNNSPTGNLVIYVYAHSGTFGTSSVPTGAALATSDTKDIGTIAISHHKDTFAFSGANKIALTPGNYCYAISYAGGDATHFLNIAYDNSTPTHGGNYYTSNNCSSWTSNANRDFIFWVYATLPASDSPYYQIMY